MRRPENIKEMNWCFLQSSGITLIEPNTNLAFGHILKAEVSLNEMQNTKSRTWKIITAYYTMYESVYAILMKYGIKCEIHNCTIAFVRFFLSNHFSSGEIDLLEDSCTARGNVQY